jgi:hypothetical protein
MSRSPLPNRLDAWLVGADQQQALLGRSIGHCSIRLGIDHHGHPPGPRNTHPRVGMGC